MLRSSNFPLAAESSFILFLKYLTHNKLLTGRLPDLRLPFLLPSSLIKYLYYVSCTILFIAVANIVIGSTKEVEA